MKLFKRRKIELIHIKAYIDVLENRKIGSISI